MQLVHLSHFRETWTIVIKYGIKWLNELFSLFLSPLLPLPISEIFCSTELNHYLFLLHTILFHAFMPLYKGPSEIVGLAKLHSKTC